MELIQLFYTTIIPIGLITVMAGMGLSLTIDDIKRIVVYPKAAAIGLTGQMLLVPLIGFTLSVFISPTPAIATSIIILAACPGGPTSNAYVFASRADVALSVTLTGITSFLTIITIPLFTYLALQLHFDTGQIPDLPVLKMMRQLATLTVIPIIGGMLFRAFWPKLAEKLVEPMRTLAFWILIILIVGGTISGWDTIKEHFIAVAASALLLNLISMSMGYLLARIFALPLSQVITICFELGIQNIAVAMTIGLVILQRPDLGVTALIYALLMKVSALSLMAYARRSLSAVENNDDYETIPQRAES